MKLLLHYYYFQIYMAMEAPAKQKREILAMLKGNVEEYLRGHPNCKISDVRRYFGAPMFVAASYGLDESFCSQKKNIQKRIWKTILWTLLGLLVLFLVFFLVLYLVQQITIPTYLR